MDFHLDQHDPRCGCCGANATESILNDLSVMQLERRVRDYTGLRTALKIDTGDAPFVDSEADLTELLSENASSLADEVEEPILDALDRDGLNENSVATAAATSAAIWDNNSWPSTLEAKVGIALDGATLLGQHEVPLSLPLSDTERLRIVTGMSQSAKYYTNNYFNTQVMPVLVDAVHSAVLNGTSNDLQELQAIRELLDRRLRSVPYWNIVANASASRAYHYGYIKTGVFMGKRHIVYTIVRDSKTSAICLELAGKRWKAQDVNILADRIATATPEEIKTITPWLRLDDVRGLNEAQLLALGVVVPPIHGHCRSRLVWE